MGSVCKRVVAVIICVQKDEIELRKRAELVKPVCLWKWGGVLSVLVLAKPYCCRQNTKNLQCSTCRN